MARVLGMLAAVAAVAVPTVVLARPDATSPAARRTGDVVVVHLGTGAAARDYRLFRPAALPAGPRPLVVALHPLHSSAAAFEANTGLDEGAAGAGAVVVYPDGLGHSWDAGTCCQPAAAARVDDVRFLAAVVADVAARVPVDRRRVAFVGLSNGALMSYRFACERSDVVRAVVAVAGDVVAPRCSVARPVSVLHVHGIRDNVIPWAGVRRSPIDPAGFPDVARSVERIASLQRCGAWTATVHPPLTTRVAAGCAGGATVTLLTSATLGHAWPRGSQARQRYGVDATAATWAFLRGRWAAAG